jgi:hypothetical protein
MIKNIKTEQKLEYREYRAILGNNSQMVVCIDGLWSKDALIQMYSCQVFKEGFKTNFFDMDLSKPIQEQMGRICSDWERIV